MKNRYKYKKNMLLCLIIGLFIPFIVFIINSIEYKKYTKNFNIEISKILVNVKENYPDIDDEEIINEILDDNYNEDYLKKYSIDLNNKSLIKENKKVYNKYISLSIIFSILPVATILIIFTKYERCKSKEIDKIVKCIERINKKNYKLNIDEISEDELSILKNEIYKTSIMLKEDAENAKKDKIELKKSLSDISHQLKTPLTSILIILDNLIENPDMDENIRNDFIRDIKREITNINFLVQNILKLSRLDTNTVKFDNKKNSLKEIINKCISNLVYLCELKNIEIVLNMKSDCLIMCDFNWQVEAITNVIKNGIEHSFDDSKIIVDVNDNKVYTKIDIINYGDEIPADEINYIFNRFYKGKNTKSDAVGIGLALSKSIIEKNNGNISVESSDNKTIFTIKYFK